MFFYEVRNVEQALIQQIVTSIDDQYLIAMKRNHTTGQFNGNVLQILQYLQLNYSKISPSQLADFESEIVHMHYDLTSPPIDNVFNNIEDLLEYGD